MNNMEKRILSRLEKGLKLTKAQCKWAEEEMGKYDDNCQWCYFNLLVHLGVDPWEPSQQPLDSPKNIQ